MEWYKYNINDMTEKEYDTFFSLMEKSKKKRILRLKNIDDKKRSVCAEMLVKREIAKKIGISPKKVVLDLLDGGKPFCKNADIHFNISHSGDYAVCAFGNFRVGIDIQKIVPYKEKTAERVCSKSELEAIEKSPDKAAEFIKIWTKKEAVMKMKGIGIFGDAVKTCLFDTEIETVRFSDYFVSICEEKNIGRF